MNKKRQKTNDQEAPSGGANHPVRHKSSKQVGSVVGRVNQAVDKIAKSGKARGSSDQPSPQYRPSKDMQKYFASKRRNWPKVTGLISILALAVIFAQAVIYYFTLREVARNNRIAQEALANTREAFRQDQRPYIWVTNSLGAPQFVPNPITKADSPVGQVDWSWHYTNYGKTPAYGIRYWEYIRVGQHAETLCHGMRPEGDPGAPLPPGKDDFSTVISEPGIGREEFLSLAPTNDAVSIRVVMQYTDAYGGKYETDICLVRLPTNAIGYCSTGNDIK